MSLKKEKALVKKAQKNPRYFDELYREYVNRIRNYINKKVNDKELTEELTSVVFEKALSKLSSFKWQGVSFGCWLFRIARNTTYDYFRSTRNGGKTSSLEEEFPHEVSSGIGLEASLLHDEREMALYEMISQLEDKDQYLLYYRYFENMSVKEVAKEVSMSESNVATRLHRIRDRLKGLIG